MTPRQVRLGSDIFTGAVVASVGLAAAGLSWRLQGYTGTSPAAAPVAPGPDQSGDIRPVLALAPFGNAATSPVAAAGGDASFKLRAIFMAMPAEASIVLIAGADGKVASYGIGQTVGDGVIESIAPEQITLRTGAGVRIVGFTPSGGGAGGTPPTVFVPVPTAVTVPPPPAPAPPNAGVAAVRALIPPSAQRPPPPATPPQPAPPAASAGGGLRVGASPPPLLTNAGIRPGDVIERVNGTAVGAGVSERELIAQAVAAGSARIELIRNGQRLSLSVPVR